MATVNYNPFENAQAQFDRVADVLQLDSGLRALLREPMKEIHFSIPVPIAQGLLTMHHDNV